MLEIIVCSSPLALSIFHWLHRSERQPFFSIGSFNFSSLIKKKRSKISSMNQIMANSVFFCSSLISPSKPGMVIAGSGPRKVIRVREVFKSSNNARNQTLEVKATKDSDPTTKVNSIVCPDCEGNGNKQCSECLGTGVNSVDHFNGQFKAGGLCWLCRGKREILCGNCNGAGFMGGFMSTFDE